MPACGQRAELQCGQKILAFKVGIVREHVFNRHAGGEKVKQRLDRITQTTHHRLTVTHNRVHGDSVQP